MLDSAIQVLNEAGETWWSYVFPLTWTSSLVATILLTVIWIGRRWPAQLRYAIVLVALIKFAIPPTLTAPVGLFSWFGPTIIERTESSALSDQPMDSEADNSTWATILSAWEQLNWRAHLMLLHITGMVLAASWTISRLVQLAGMARRAKCVAGGKWFDSLARLSKQFGLNRPVLLLVSHEAVPPMAFGLLRPCVMVPASVLQDLPSRQIKTMLAHELAHHKRADLWINALQNVLGILWWFNPLLRLLNQVIRRIREDCCDDLLLCRNIATDSKYCQILLQIASNLSRSARMIAALGFAETIHPLGRRIKRIMDPKVYRWTRLSFGTAASIAILAALLLPGLRSERPITSADTPLVLEVLAPTEPHVVEVTMAEGLLEKLPTNTQDQTEELAGSFPQQTEGIQPRVHPSVKAISKIAVASTSPNVLKAADSADIWNQDNDTCGSIANIITTVATSHLDTVKEQRSRRDDFSQSTLLLSSTFSGYGGGLTGGVGSGYAKMDALASDILASNYFVEGSSANLTALSFAWNASAPYMSSIAEPSFGNEPGVLEPYELDLVEWTGVLSPLESPFVLSSLSTAASTSATALIEAPDTGTACSVDDPPDRRDVLIACATPVASLGDTIEFVESVNDEADAGIVLASNLGVGDSHPLYRSVSDTDVLDLSPLTEALDTVDVTDSVALAYADVPSFIDFANSLIPSSHSSSFTVYSLSNPDGTSVLGAGSSCLSSSSYTAATIPEPTTIWVLLAGSLLLLCRRHKRLIEIPTQHSSHVK